MAAIKTIGVIAFKEVKAITPALEIIKKWSKKNKDTQFLLHDEIPPTNSAIFEIVKGSQILKSCDLILSLGGDGTFLSSARFVGGRNIPILGVNLGRTGFLSDVSIDKLSYALDQIKNGEYQITKRMMLGVEIHQGKKIRYKDIALNDVVFSGKMGMELIDLHVELDDEDLTDYWVDGLLVSTPTGSTAYSLSAGGPIIHPNSSSILLTPINPKSLSIRPIVLPQNCSLKISSKNHREKMVRMITDGRHEQKILPQDTIYINKHRHSASILRPLGTSYMEAIRNKLGWQGVHRAGGKYAP